MGSNGSHGNGNGAANGRAQLLAYVGARLREQGVDVRGPEECWNARGRLYAHTGARVNVGGSHTTTLRYAFALAFGYEPTGALHRTCQNHRCLNVLAHVTQRVPRTLMTDSQRYNVRRLARGGAAEWDIARRFGLTIDAVRRAVDGLAL